MFLFFLIRPVNFGPNSLHLPLTKYFRDLADKEAQGEVPLDTQADLFASS